MQLQRQMQALRDEYGQLKNALDTMSKVSQETVDGHPDIDARLNEKIDDMHVYFDSSLISYYEKNRDKIDMVEIQSLIAKEIAEYTSGTTHRIQSSHEEIMDRLDEIDDFIENTRARN